MLGWWVASSGLLVAWLRGDPESMRGLSKVAPLYEAQGVVFLLPAPGEPVIADVAVLPREGSPEGLLYDYSVVRASRIVRKPGFRESLFDALSGPRGFFRSLVIGLDPGRECGASVIGDGLLLDASRMPCGEVGGYARGILADAPYRVYSIYLGDGPGFEDAAASLSGEGLEYTVLEEGYTTRGPLPGGGLVKDKDILASIRIAYKGVYGGDWVARRVPRGYRSREGAWGSV